MLAISSYGRFWRRDRIHWGGGYGNPAHLNGRLKSKKSTVVDFREQIGIYVLFDEMKRPMYIGQAGISESRLLKRLLAHTKDHLRDRWQYFSWFGLRRKNDVSDRLSDHQDATTAVHNKKLRDALHEIEAVLISTVEPPLNKKNSNWQGSQEYLQIVDGKPAKDFAKLLDELVTKATKIEKKLDKALGKKKSI